MTWYLLLALLLVVVAATVVRDWMRSGRPFCVPLPRPFRDRQSQEAAWRQACQDESLDSADTLLQTLCEAVSSNPDDRYRFAPTDRILDVYQACYPRWRFWNLADSMEMETLLMELQRRFQLDDTEALEITLAEVVELMK